VCGCQPSSNLHARSMSKRSRAFLKKKIETKRKMTKFWMTLTNDENWDMIRLNGIYAVKSKKHYDQLNEGDKIVMYLIPKRICALYEIKSIPSKQDWRFKNKEFKYYFDIKPNLILKNPLQISTKSTGKEIINNVSIFREAKRWGTVLMGRTIIEITGDDYDYVKKEMDKSEFV